MINHVTYLLGAGFSAPLGLPVMNNFLIKSKDIYASESEKYPHFKEVFDQITAMNVAKSYYSADLFNIEEILSMLEIQEFIERGRLRESFIQYIRDVIKYYTPLPIPGYGSADCHQTGISLSLEVVRLYGEALVIL
jgi:hypothetical protein